MTAESFFGASQWVFLAYFIGINLGYLALNLVAIASMRRHLQAAEQLEAESLFSSLDMPISIVMPAFNEAVSIISSVKALLQLEYSDFELIVVNDGSSDETLDKLVQAFALRPFPEAYWARVPCSAVRAVYRSSRHPALRVVDKENGGSKADAVNAGINACRYPLVCVVDADSVLEPDSLRRVVRPFLEDPTTVAVGGTVRIANGCTIRRGFIEKVGLPRSFLALVQVVEYLRGFLFGRLGWSPLNALLIVSGAFGVFRKDALIEVGGYDPTSIGEDMELILRLHRRMKQMRRPYRITFVPDPVCWTDAPETLKGLKSQRVRWQHGLGESLFRNAWLMFNPRGGSVSWLAIPFYLLFELFGPIIEVAGYAVIAAAAAAGALSVSTALLFLAMAVALGILLSSSAVMLEELSFHLYPRTRDVLTLYLVAVLENFGYRQLTALWRVQGVLRWLFRGRRRHKWESIMRTDSLSDETQTLGRLPSAPPS
ncbi:MAG TPA: glycosyltransferase family 2 protein [Gammaproteobacteria bacterium]|nr:glycosyltransferase family 2 protein [Gammaproteobacteria bacterium]